VRLRAETAERSRGVCTGMIAPERLSLPYTADVAAETEHLYARVARTVTRAEWELYAPYVARIEALKRERKAVVLAHHYQSAEIYRCVADIVGDSLALAQAAATTDADAIVMCGVHFMAETAKLLNPQKAVLLPDLEAGCSLADSIAAADVRALRAKHPGVPVVTYVNTSAAVKAESDICCTSANAVATVESLGVPKVIFLPDQYLAAYVASKTAVEIVTWQGHCEVHERFTGEQIAELRAAHADLVVLAHPECPADVLAQADFVGSTTAMLGYVKERRPARVAMITECSMGSNLADEFPEIEFTQPCNLCPHMRRITLPKILRALETMSPQIEIDPSIADRARLAVERMTAVKRDARVLA
jgi:quinolinate synthase